MGKPHKRSRTNWHHPTTSITLLSMECRAMELGGIRIEEDWVTYNKCLSALIRYDLMMWSWQSDPARRPTFRDLCTALETLIVGYRTIGEEYC